ncbi:LPS export ABC transporter periplasmic protein LptC [Viridibacterium curvum]|uniref:LPS export ABC transporter periplasmic protein LptC n=1 Tax=Viridibacterium curvum TaxID=1101404 RepID=A0ABP9R1A0_9RHOO
MRRLAPAFPLIVAAMLALATWWLERTVSLQGVAGASKARTAPDAIVENFRISRYKTTGDLGASLEGTHMEHFPVDDSADIQKPVLSFVGENSSRTSVLSGETAHVTKRGELVEIKGKVRGERDGSRAGKPATILQTEILNVLPREEFAYTSAPLAVTQGRMQMNGVGAEWNNITGLLKVWQLDATIERPKDSEKSR